MGVHLAGAQGVALEAQVAHLEVLVVLEAAVQAEVRVVLQEDHRQVEEEEDKLNTRNQ